MNLNDFFPNKVCINLERRNDRWQRMQTRFAQHQLQKVVRFPALDGRTLNIPASWDDFPGAYGCLRSHLAVIEQARQLAKPSVLIFEDDVILHPDLGRRFADYSEQLSDDWDMLFFGAIHGEPAIQVSENIVKVTHVLSTYAYALKHTIYDAYIELNRQALTVLDENTRALQKRFNSYCFMPHLAWVEEDYSDVREEKSSVWWLSESLVLWGEDVDRLEAKTAGVIYHCGRTEESLNNLRFIVDYFSRQLPTIALLVVEQAGTPSLNKEVLPAQCELLFLPEVGDCQRSRAFNRGIEMFAASKDFFIFLDSNLLLTREDVRANLLKCRDHDFVSACSEIWDLDQPETQRVLSNDLRWNYNGNHYTRAKADLCQSACIATSEGIQLAGGWDETDGSEGTLTSKRVKQSLRVYQSPNPARRLFQPE